MDLGSYRLNDKVEVLLKDEWLTGKVANPRTAAMALLVTLDDVLGVHMAVTDPARIRLVNDPAEAILNAGAKITVKGAGKNKLWSGKITKKEGLKKLTIELD